MNETSVGEQFSIRRIIRFETKRPRSRWKDHIVVLAVAGRDIEVRCTTPRLMSFGWFKFAARKQHGVALRDVGQGEWRRMVNGARERYGFHFGSIDSPEAPWERAGRERHAP